MSKLDKSLSLAGRRSMADGGSLFNEPISGLPGTPSGPAPTRERGFLERLWRPVSPEDPEGFYEEKPWQGYVTPRPVGAVMNMLPESAQTAVALPALVPATPEILLSAGHNEANEAYRRAGQTRPEPKNYRQAAHQLAGDVLMTPVGLVKGIGHMISNAYDLYNRDQYVASQPVDDANYKAVQEAVVDPQARRMAAFDVAGLAPLGAAGAGAAGAAFGAVPDTGDVGMFAGRRARTADRTKLAHAERMEMDGAPREQIWRETGWFRGADGDWRFEIDDSLAKPALPAKDWIERRDGQLMAPNIGRAYNVTLNTLGTNDALAFRDLFSHPELMAAYPAIGRIPAQLMAQNLPYAGAIHPGGIAFNEALPPMDFRSTALHEAQHLIQQAEGFAQGSTPTAAMETPEYRSEIMRLEQRKPDNDWQSIDPWTPSAVASAIYRRHAGEVESRAVQARRDMTPEQRRFQPPWQSYDIPERLQIVRRDPGMSFAMREEDGLPRLLYHGSPYDFDAFDSSKALTGHGANAYGHGIYLTEDLDVAKNYAPRDEGYEGALTQLYQDAERRGDYDGMEVAEAAMLHKTPKELAAEYGDRPEAQDMLSRIAELPQRHGIYEVKHSIDPSRVIDHEASFTNQSPYVQEQYKDYRRSLVAPDAIEALRNDFLENGPYGMSEKQFSELLDEAIVWGGYGPNGEAVFDYLAEAAPSFNRKTLPSAAISPEDTGGQLYRAIAGDTAPEASKAWAERGVSGMRYKDRDAGNSTNYVVFDDKNLNIADFYANPEEAGLMTSALAAERARKTNQTPFYGADVGPKGRIADPQAEASRLGLQSGVAEAPVDGFFNPASSALLQAGVAPKQTVAYYAKQMGSRGGKLPPGQWQDITKGLKPDQVIERDWLVKEIDKRAPRVDIRSSEGPDGWARDGRTANLGEPQYENWATAGNFDNYNETAVGYSGHEKVDTRFAPPSVIERAKKANEALPGEFRDNHFDHPNLEGWYRTQDLGTTRILEELQPQRYQKERDIGPKVSPEKLSQIEAQLDLARVEAEKAAYDGFAFFGQHTHLPFDPSKELTENLRIASQMPGGAAAHAVRQEVLRTQDAYNHVHSQWNAGRLGVAPSPYSYDVNVATDWLLKNVLKDAGEDGVNRLVWAHGEAQADRYNQRLKDVKALRYVPYTGSLLLKRGSSNWKSLPGNYKPEQLSDVVGKETAAQLLSSERKPQGVTPESAAHELQFPNGMTLGGEGMLGFYGDGQSPGIVGERLQSLLSRLGQEDTSIRPTRVKDVFAPSPYNQPVDYPSIPLDHAAMQRARDIGLPLYANPEESAIVGAGIAAERANWLYRGDYRADRMGKWRIVEEEEGGSGGIYLTDDPEIASNYATGKNYIGDDWWSVIENATTKGKKLSDVKLNAKQRVAVDRAVVNYINDDGDKPISQRTWDDYLQRNKFDRLRAAEDVLLNGAIMDRAEFEAFIDKLNLFPSVYFDNPAEARPAVTPVNLASEKPFNVWDATPEELQAIEDIVGPDDMTLWQLKLAKETGDTETMTTVSKPFREALLQLGYDSINDIGGRIVGNREHNVAIAIKPGTVRSATTGETLFSNKDELAIPGAAIAAERAKQTKPIETPPGRQLDKHGFYSALGEALNTMPMKQGTPQQFLNALTKAGVTKDEMRWTGMDEHLKSLPPNEKVQADALRAYFTENAVVPRKKIFDKDGYTDDEVNQRAEEYARDLAKESLSVDLDKDWIQARKELYSIEEDPDAPGTYRIMSEEDPDNPVGWDYKSEDKAQRALDSHVAAEANDFGEWAIYRYGDLIEGGYSGPGSAERRLSYVIDRKAEDYWYDTSTDEIRRQLEMPRGVESLDYLDDRPEGGQNYSERIFELPPEVLKQRGIKGEGVHAHFRDDVENVPGWLLTEDYHDMLSDRPALMIHEAQSDWGQKGREAGWNTGVTPEQQKAADDRLADAMDARGNFDRYRYVDSKIGVFKVKPEVAATYSFNIGATDSASTLYFNEGNLKKARERFENFIAANKGREADPDYAPLYNKEKQVLDYQENQYAKLKQSWDEFYAPKLEPVSYPNKTTPMPGAEALLDEYNAWNQTRVDLDLRLREANQARDALSKGVNPGPWVEDTSKWTALLLKSALYDAAKSGKEYLAWDPKGPVDRWGDHLSEYYNKTVPNVALKLAKQHDPEARIGAIFPGKQGAGKPKGTYYENSHYRTDQTEVVPREPQLFGDQELTPLSGHQSLEVSSIKPIVGVNMDRGFDRRPTYRLMTGNSIYDTVGPSFRSRDAAERAMQVINTQLARREGPTPEKLRAANEYETPAIEITPRMRESILKRGFPLFVNGAPVPLPLDPNDDSDVFTSLAIRRALGY